MRGQAPPLGRTVALLLLAAALLLVLTMNTSGARLTDADAVAGNIFNTSTMAAPTSLTATVTSNNVVLNWTATATAYAAGTQVLRSTTSGSGYSQIAQITPRTTATYTDSPGAGTYYYVVRAYYQNWQSATGNEASATVGVRFVQTVGTATRSSSGNSSITITVAAGGVAAGDSIIVAITTGTSGGAVGCSDTKSNSYTVDADVTGGNRLFICSAHNVTALTSSDTITATYPGFSGVSAASANEFSGIASSAAVDQVHTATGNNTTPTSGSTGTTAQASELLFGAIAHNSTPTFTHGSGYTLAGQAIGGSGSAQKTLSPEYQLVSVTGSYTAGGTLSSGQQWQAAIVTYKASP